MRQKKLVSNLLLFSLFIIGSCQKDDIFPSGVKDSDGNSYKTVTIGDQVWMAENLKTTTYNDGTPIEYVEDWDIEKGRYCWYDHDEGNKNPHGALYNWYAVNTGELAPEGWRVATREDWEKLKETLGGKLIAGGKIKKRGEEIWEEPNKLVDPDCGFNAYPSGGIYLRKFENFGSHAIWWTHGERSIFYAIYNDNTSIGSAGSGSPKIAYFSVRCVKE